MAALRFGFDYVSAISDPAREASDLGATVEWFDNQPPAIVESRALLDDKSKLAGLRQPDLAAPGRMRNRVEAVRLLAEHRDIRLDLATIPPEDPATYEMIRHAD